MKFANDTNLQKFLQDKPYYENPDDYCLGREHSEAALVFKAMLSGCLTDNKDKNNKGKK